MKKLQSLFGFGKKPEAEKRAVASKGTKLVAAKKSAPSRGKVPSKAKAVEEKEKPKKNIFGW